MSVSGNLKTMLPGDLLQWLSLGQKSGTLVVSHAAVEKKIFFKSGRVLSSASNDPREYLGQFLMSHGFLSEGELKKAMEVQQQSGILLGKILTTIGLISEQDLLRLMRLKAEEEIYDIFLWNEGEFHFIDNQLPQMEMVPLKIDVTGIIMEGTRRFDEWPRIRQVIPDDAVIPSITKPVHPNADLDEAQRKIVEAVDGKRTIGLIVLESRSSSFAVCSTLYYLASDGFAQFRSSVAAKPVPVTTDVAPFATDFDEGDEIQALLNAAQTALKNHDFEKTQRVLRAAQNLDPNHARVRSAIKGAEAVILAELRNQGISDSKIPRMVKTIEEITTMNFSPNEGFLLSRINGTWDVGSIIKISPIREPEAMLIFYRLLRDAIIVLE